MTGRRADFAVLAVLGSVLLAACTGTGADGGAPAAASSAGPPSAGATPSATPTADDPSPSPSAARPAGCRQVAASLSRRDQVGQLLMVGVDSTRLSRGAADALERTAAGSVVLLGNSRTGQQGTARVVEAVRATGQRPQGAQTLVAVDQEGGQVQRLRGRGFSTIPAARRQAEIPDAELVAAARRWGRELRRAGVDATLAPVADVVPADLERVNAPIGQLGRGYGPSPAVVADKVTAFTRGMDAAGVATAVKHFPGLGRVRGNTDLVADVVDRSTTRRDPALRGFRAGVAAGADLVMVSSASYARIDAGRRAVFSPVVLDPMLRDDLGFAGVVVSDDLSAVALADLGPGERAVRFLAAGGDLAIVGDPREAPAAAAAVRERADRDEEFADRLTTSAARVLSLKARRGLADCAP